MYELHYFTATRHEFRKVSTLWAANLLAYKYVKEWGWDRAYIMDSETGELMREYIKG